MPRTAGWPQEVVGLVASCGAGAGGVEAAKVGLQVRAGQAGGLSRF